MLRQHRRFRATYRYLSNKKRNHGADLPQHMGHPEPPYIFPRNFYRTKVWWQWLAAVDDQKIALRAGGEVQADLIDLFAHLCPVSSKSAVI